MKETVWSHRRLASGYIRILKTMLPSIEEDTENLDEKVIPFIITCAAALECLFNDNIIAHTFETFGEDNYKRYTDGLIAMGLRRKLDYIIPLLSENKYTLKSTTNTYQQLAKLISVRNRIMHAKSSVEEYEILEFEKGEIPKIVISAPAEHFTQVSLFNISINEAKKFFEALLNFYSVIENFSEWEKSDLIEKV